MLLNKRQMAEDNMFCEDNQINMNYKKRENSVVQHKVFESLTTFVHIFIIGFILFILYLCLTNELVFFTWHPVLLSCGWLLLMAEGILMLTPNNVMTKRLSLLHKSKVQYHWIIQAVGIGCSVIGFAVIYINKILKDKPHFHSWHGLLGLISVICCIPACTSGIVALYNISFKSYVKPVNSKLIHRICGILTFFAGSITVLLSLYTKWFERRVNEAITVMWFILIIMIMIWTVLQASIKVCSRLKSIL